MEIEKEEDEDLNSQKSEISAEEWRGIFERLNSVDSVSNELIIDKVVHQIISLNKSTLSYWWRGGKELNGSQLEHFFNDADTNKNGKMSLEEFVQSWNETKIISKSTKLYIAQSLQTLAFAKRITKCPPPLFCITIGLVQITAFILATCKVKGFDSSPPGGKEDYLDFYWSKPYEIYRYFTYALVHGSWLHLVCVLSVELVMGLLQETVHGSLSVGLIFTAGVLAGSLSSFVFSRGRDLIGGSAGCYALIGAQLASLLLNWSEDQAIVISRIRRGKQKHVWHGKLLRLLKLLALIVFIGIDVVHTVTMSRMNNISVVAHVFGFIGGLLSAVSLIRDRREQDWERRLKLVSSAALVLLLVAGVISNVVVAIE